MVGIIFGWLVKSNDKSDTIFIVVALSLGWLPKNNASRYMRFNSVLYFLWLFCYGFVGVLFMLFPFVGFLLLRKMVFYV